MLKTATTNETNATGWRPHDWLSRNSGTGNGDKGDGLALSRRPCNPCEHEHRIYIARGPKSGAPNPQSLAQSHHKRHSYAVEQLLNRHTTPVTLAERILLMVDALPSDDSSVTLTRADLAGMVEESRTGDTGDLTVEQVAAQTRRAPSTIRGWLIDGELRGYKLNERHWRVTRDALEEYLGGQTSKPAGEVHEGEPVDISAWRKAT